MRCIFFVADVISFNFRQDLFLKKSLLLVRGKAFRFCFLESIATTPCTTGVSPADMSTALLMHEHGTSILLLILEN